MTAAEVEAVQRTVLAAYRWQYIVSGVQEPRFRQALGGMITERQARAHRRGAGADHGLPVGDEAGLGRHAHAAT